MIIKIESDGTPLGTRVVDENGEPIQGATAISWEMKDCDSLASAVIAFESMPISAVSEIVRTKEKTLDFGPLCRHCHLPEMNCSCETNEGFHPPYKPPFHNGLTPAEAERLFLLIEEASEVQQAATKILRHGYESFHPEDPTLPNRGILEKELGDLSAAVHILYRHKDVSEYNVNIYTGDKMKRVRRYLHHTDVNPGEHQ